MLRQISKAKPVTPWLLLALFLMMGTAGPAHAQFNPTGDTPLETSPPPPELTELQSQNSDKTEDKKEEETGLQIRKTALRESALSYGARGGLAFRTFQIQRRLAEQDASLSRIFDFKRLLITAPSGLLIEPPIVSEAEKAVIVASGGQEAAVADKVYRINRVARIVTAPRDWHLYLERDWGKVEAPPGLLLPKKKDKEEVAQWGDWVQEGWNAGLEQADDIFQADLDRMTNDFTGMVRYRELLAQGMISAPFALHEDRGVTGGGSEMRIGDRGVMITGPSELIAKSQDWKAQPVTDPMPPPPKPCAVATCR